MMLTFGQYNTLAATRQRATHGQLSLQTEFNDLMVGYYVAGLLASDLIRAVYEGDNTRYELTEAGKKCLIDYERQNPELTVTRMLHLNSLR